MEKVKLGIVGLGRLGRNHARNICFGIPEAELAAVCSAVPAELDEVCAEMHPRWRYDDYREMFQNKELDGVVIASNSQVHCEMAIEVARLAHPERYWLLVETGDETLDHRHAVARYAGARQTVLPGGDHSFTRWPEFLDDIIGFCS